MANQSRYRQVYWIGGRILEAREMMTFQQIYEGNFPNGTRNVYDMDQLYRDGATMNMRCNIAGRTVTMIAIDGSLPMSVFVRGRWEVLNSGDLGPVTLTTGQANIYLNWVLRIVSYPEDSTLIDTSTSQPTASMGEIDFVIGNTDTSGASLDSGVDLEKNTSPIIMFQFTTGVGTMSQIFLDNVNEQALANDNTSGLVNTTTTNATVVSTDDSRMSDARDPLPASVENVSVRTPVTIGGTNARDGSDRYNLTGDPGGISADKIIYVQETERLSDYLAYIETQIAAAVSSGVASFDGRTGVVVPTAGDYTAAQVGAAPSSHVGLPLAASGVTSGSHPATVTANSGGYVLNQTSGVFSGPIPWGSIPTPNAAYGLVQSGVLKAGLLHTGDFLSTALNTLVTAPGGSPLNFTGALTGLLSVAQVLKDHVNQTSGSTNPHGITTNTIGIEASLGLPGYLKIPIGSYTLMIQWMLGSHSPSATSNRGSFSETWPNPFPNACFAVFPSVHLSSTNSTANWEGIAYYVQPGTYASAVPLYFDYRSDGNPDTNSQAFLIGIGY